jgi:hypothetical protein
MKPKVQSGFDIGANGCHNQSIVEAGDELAATQVNGTFLDTERGLALQQSIKPAPNEWL